MMIKFNVNEQEFIQIKNGIKTYEYKEFQPYWRAKLVEYISKGSIICFACMYSPKCLYAKVLDIKIIKNSINIHFKLLT